MKKKLLLGMLMLPLALMPVACDDKNDDGPDMEVPDNPDADDPAEEEPAFRNLSADEMANCYIVQAPGEYGFKADNRFNLGEGLPVPPELHPHSARMVWQSVQGSISAVSLEDLEGKDGSKEPYIRFTVEKASGNALLALLDKDENIIWSWHIWMPEEEITGVKTATGYEVMNMNLGARTGKAGDPSSYGMLYQWGRKDPFPAAATLTGDTQTVGAPLYDIDNNPVMISNSSWTSSDCNTLAYSIANPTVCLSNYSYYSSSRDWLRESDDALWGNPQGDARDRETNTYPNKGRKTCYDPSPAGWRVAPADVFSHFTSSGGYAWDIADFNVADINGDGITDLEDYNYGWHFNMDSTTPLYFPAAARYDGSYAMLMGSMSGLWGSYWSNAPYSDIPGGAFCALSFQVKGMNGEDWVTVSPSGGASRADAFSIRCVRDN